MKAFDRFCAWSTCHAITCHTLLTFQMTFVFKTELLGLPLQIGDGGKVLLGKRSCSLPKITAYISSINESITQKIENIKTGHYWKIVRYKEGNRMGPPDPFYGLNDDATTLSVTSRFTFTFHCWQIKISTCAGRMHRRNLLIRPRTVIKTKPSTT